MTVAKKFLAEYEEGWTVAELKLELQKRQMLATGNKGDLIERLAKEDQRLARKAAADERKAAKAAPAEVETQAQAEEAGPAPDTFEAPTEEEVSFMAGLAAIAEFLSRDGVNISITISGDYSPTRAPAPTETNPTQINAVTPQEPGTVSREEVRDAARQLLAIQPDGRSRALNVLGQYGGSVSAVPEEQLEQCLAAFTAELEAVS